MPKASERIRQRAVLHAKQPFCQKSRNAPCDRQKLRPVLERFNAAGIPSGIDVLCTIGFFEDGLDPIMESESYPHYVSVYGSVTAGRLCPEYAVNRDYIAEQYRIYAELHPDRIYIDDDISSMSCFCPACIRRFAREYGVLDEPCATRTAA